jgi:hypothetical protein
MCPLSDLMLGLMDGSSVSFGSVLAWNLIPVTIGNIIGGLFFICVQVFVYSPYFKPHPLTVSPGMKQAARTRLLIAHGPLAGLAVSRQSDIPEAVNKV